MTEFADSGPWLRFVIAALATWRITHLLALEDGPLDAIANLRVRLGRAGPVLDCFYCLSLWVAAPLALFVSTALETWWCVWLALSGAACLINQVSAPPLVMQHLKGEQDGMLWTETSRDVEHRRASPTDQPDIGAPGASDAHIGASRGQP